MSLSVGEIAAVVGEIAPVLTGAWIQKIYQPTARAIVLATRAPGQTLLLYLSTAPGVARLHVLSRKLPNPDVPLPFCQILRAHIQGARIQAVEQVPNDRIVRLRLTAREGPCSLIAELTGRRPGILLLNQDEKVLAMLNSQREKRGQPYAIPSRRSRPHEKDQAEEPLLPDVAHPFPISFAIERRYQAREKELALAQLRQARLASVRKEIKRTGRLVQRLQADLEKADRYRDFARYGELLKANLHSIAKGQDQITVVDYYDPALPELVIPLDPGKTPKGNLDDYFKKYRKYLVAQREVRPRLEAAEQALAQHRAELTVIESGTWKPEPEGTARPFVLDRHRKATLEKPARSQAKRAGPFRRFQSADGLPIYVGRNARENEELTFEMGRSDDLWFHARGAPGSHVLVRLEKGSDPPAETVRDAATLALLFSDLKKSGQGEVIYTRQKFVRKVKRQSPGTVSVTREKAIFVTLDKTRLEALKERSR